MEKNTGSKQIYGFGASLGAAILLQSLETETRFQSVIAESPFYDFVTVADERIARILPEGTKWVAGPFVASGITWARPSVGQPTVSEWIILAAGIGVYLLLTTVV